MRDEGGHDEEAAAREKMREAILCAFCHVMQTTRLRPMKVLRLAAMAVGTIYRDVATAHERARTCPCGWEPCADDVEALQTAIAATAKPTPAKPTTDLRWLKIAGKA